MGFRVIRNTPLVTSADVVSGFVGLTVVLARRNMPIAENPNSTPITTSRITISVRYGTVTADPADLDSNHITTANPNATKGGGTFSSSEVILRSRRIDDQ